MKSGVMRSRIHLKPPLFEVGLKGYMYGEEAVRLAREADRISKQYEIPIIFDPQHVDIPRVAHVTTDLLVFAQHMDPVAIGKGHGRVLPEALRDAGAVGVILNHAERRMHLNDIARAIERADDVGLASIVCADSPEEAAAIAHLHPDIVLAEPPELIGTGKSVGKEKSEFIHRTLEMVKAIDLEIIVFISGGIRTAEDVAEVIRMGAEATGCTSAIMEAEDPVKTTEEMVRALREAWRGARGSSA